MPRLRRVLSLVQRYVKSLPEEWERYEDGTEVLLARNTLDQIVHSEAISDDNMFAYLRQINDAIRARLPPYAKK